MESRERKYNGQIEINDLIDDAVKNAVERRNQGLGSEDALSDEEMKNVAGGIFQLPTMTTMGIIAPDQDQTLLA
ncbi:hypothetical protein LC608_29220 [Nostoc sp. XA010]|uniref:hypothetical protein n=1 Tax=Nostoc sp. XA010 TaxID=2780407 RepID=UPI001E4B1B59|nr:hypothetical protein [Nostoc sp. XA010]MCC5660981.1 hypothetical protein [Nostoc sp. XA010]